MRENERKKDDWVSRLGNLKDDFLIHEKYVFPLRPLPPPSPPSSFPHLPFYLIIVLPYQTHK